MVVRWLMRQSTGAWVAILAVILLMGVAAWFADRSPGYDAPQASQQQAEAAEAEAAALRACDVEIAYLSGTLSSTRTNRKAIEDALLRASLAGTVEFSGNQATVTFSPAVNGDTFAPFIAASALFLGNRVAAYQLNCAGGSVLTYP